MRKRGSLCSGPRWGMMCGTGSLSTVKASEIMGLYLLLCPGLHQIHELTLLKKKKTNRVYFIKDNKLGDRYVEKIVRELRSFLVRIVFQYKWPCLSYLLRDQPVKIRQLFSICSAHIGRIVLESLVITDRLLRGTCKILTCRGCFSVSVLKPWWLPFA